MPAPKPARKLVVYANPYFALDHNGQPCGAVRADIKNVRRWIGAKLVVKVNVSSMIDGTEEVSGQDNWFEFSKDPQSIEDTRAHRQAISDGHLIPGDAWSAHRACFPHHKVEYVEPAMALAAARTAAIAEWTQHYGEPPECAEESSPEVQKTTKQSAPVAPAKGA